MSEEQIRLECLRCALEHAAAYSDEEIVARARKFALFVFDHFEHPSGDRRRRAAGLAETARHHADYALARAEQEEDSAKARAEFQRLLRVTHGEGSLAGLMREAGCGDLLAQPPHG